MGPTQAPVFTRRLISTSRLLNVDMGLSTLVDFAAVAQRRVFGLFATPVSFRPTQSPLGAVLLPQALVPVGTLRRRRAFR